MAHNLLKMAPPDTAFAKFQAEYTLIFGTRSKKAAKTTVFTSVVNNYWDKADQLGKSANQIHRNKKREDQGPDWGNREAEERKKLKATRMQMDLKKMIEAMTQVMACMYNTQKDHSKKLKGTKPIGVSPI